MKNILTLALVAVLTLSLLTACGGSGSAPSGGGSAVNPPTAKPSGNDDPCSCCPDCIPADCDCEKCECCTGGLDDHPSLTFDMTIGFELYCECGDSHIETFGRARITMHYIDSAIGYMGSAEGSGETIKNGLHEVVVRNDVVPGDLPDYEFTAQLSIRVDKGVISVGVNRFGPDESTYDWAAWGAGFNTSPSFMHDLFLDFFEDPVPPEYGNVAYPDPEVGLMVFEVPLTADIDAQGQQFKWHDIFISINLTPVD